MLQILNGFKHQHGPNLNLLFISSKSNNINNIKYKYVNDIFHHFPQRILNDGLSDEELSLQFTMSWETWMNPNVWLKDWDLQSNPSQASFSSLRYRILP